MGRKRWDFYRLSDARIVVTACECPLLLNRLPWTTSVFHENACDWSVTASADHTAPSLRQFYAAAPGCKPPANPLTWLEVTEAPLRDAAQPFPVNL